MWILLLRSYLTFIIVTELNVLGELYNGKTPQTLMPVLPKSFPTSPDVTVLYAMNITFLICSRLAVFIGPTEKSVWIGATLTHIACACFWVIIYDHNEDVQRGEADVSNSAFDFLNVLGKDNVLFFIILNAALFAAGAFVVHFPITRTSNMSAQKKRILSV
eukprot:PhF_6_TR1340/c0_g1_i1/m.2373